MDRIQYELMDSVDTRMWWYRALHDRLLGALRSAVGPAATVLDAGCGTGGFLSRLRQGRPSGRSIGVDLDPHAVAASRRKARAPVVRGSVEALPFHSGTVDAIVSVDVLCHDGVHPSNALREFYRCLKSGGVLVLHLPAFEWMKSDHDAFVDNARRFSRREVRQMLIDAGFEVGYVTYWTVILFPLMVLRRKFLPASDSDVFAYPRPVNAFLYGLMRLEYHLSMRGLTLGLGGGVLAMATKPGE